MNSWEINIPYIKNPTSFCVQLEQCEPWAMPVFSFLIYILSIIFPRCTANWSHKLNDGWVTTLCRERLFKIWRLLNTIHQSPVNMAWKAALVWTTVVPDFRKKGYMQCKPGITLKTTTPPHDLIVINRLNGFAKKTTMSAASIVQQKTMKEIQAISDIWSNLWNKQKAYVGSRLWTNRYSLNIL